MLAAKVICTLIQRFRHRCYIHGHGPLIGAVDTVIKRYRTVTHLSQGKSLQYASLSRQIHKQSRSAVPIWGPFNGRQNQLFRNLLERPGKQHRLGPLSPQSIVRRPDSVCIVIVIHWVYPPSPPIGEYPLPWHLCGERD